MMSAQEIVTRFVVSPTRDNRDAVIESHRYLCLRGARKFARPESDRADLEQVAAVGLVKAASTYRAHFNTPFEAYAWILIVGELMHYVRDHERPVRLPRWMRAMERQYARAWEVLAARNGHEPSTTELAIALGVTTLVVEQIAAIKRNHRTPNDDIEGDRAQVSGLAIEDRLAVIMAVDRLSERERIVVLGTYAAGLSQSEIAQKLGLSQSQISKILARAIGKLHRLVA